MRRQIYHLDSSTLQATTFEPVGNTFDPLHDVQVAGIKVALSGLTTSDHNGICTAFKCMHQLERIDPPRAGYIDNTNIG